MWIPSDYLHVLDGRLRVKVPEVKRSPRTARLVEETLQSVTGVTQVTANPVTGNVLVLYQSTLVSPQDIARTLHGLDCLRRDEPERTAPARTPALVAHVAHAIAQTTLEMAVRRVVSAIVFA